MLGFQAILKNQCFITTDDSIKQIWFNLKTLDNVLTHLQVALFQIIIQQSWHYFCVNFLYAQIFGDNLSNTALFHVQLTCDHLNSQLTIATPTALLAWCWPWSCLLKASYSWSYLPPLWTSFATQKHVHDILLSPYPCWSISSACDSFLQLDANFHIYSLLSVYCSFVSNWIDLGKRGINKSMWKKNAIVTES